MRNYRAENKEALKQIMRRNRMPKPTRIAQAVRMYQPDCLPHQVELLRDTKTKILGLCSGFGGGKSWVAARKVIQLLTLNPGYDGIVTEPTIPLLVKIMYPELEKAFTEAGFKWKFNKQDKIYNVLVKGKWTRVLCESMENYTRLIGINAAWIVADEFDTTKMDVALAAYHKLLGRLRAGIVRQFVIVSTPEGFRAMYQIFEVDKDSQKRLIRAKTTDNHHLPQDFIDTLRSQYPANLIDAYLEGKFVNLTSGAVYKSFDRELNGSKENVRPDDELIIGMDFNVTKMAAVLYVRRQRVEKIRIIDEDTQDVQVQKIFHDEIHAVDEFVDLFDTPAMIDEIMDRYPDHCAAGKVWIYPDASGKSRKTVNASVSDIAQLEDAGFNVEYDSTNPPVKNRLIAMNTLMCNSLGQRHYLVNLEKCPTLAKCLEQQVYDLKKGEPDKTAGVDHMNDAAGYPIAHLFPVIRPIATVPTVDFY
nr:MAG: terminase large subunit [Caudoviricetes sp.]